MKILQTSIIPALSLLSLAFLNTAHAYSDAGAVQEYAGSSNNVSITGTVGTLTGTSAFGIRFSGTSGVAINNNVVTNSGTIYSGTGVGSILSGNWYFNGGSSDSVSASIVFDGSNGEQTNGNIFTNSGKLIAQADNDFIVGVLVVSSSDANNNMIINSGNINVGTSSNGNPNGGVYGIELRSGSGSLNNNTIRNSGNLLVVANIGDGRDATGIELDSENGGASNNAISNTGNVVVSGSGDNSDISGIWISSGSGSVSNNTISNSGSLVLSTIGGGEASGIRLTGHSDTSVNNNTISNSGSFEVNADGAGASAYGIELFSGNSNVNCNTFSNSGSFVVSTSGSDSQSLGIWLASSSGSVDGNIITNSGSYLVSASGNDATSAGIALGADSCNAVCNNTINNSGSLKFSTNGDNAHVLGIAIDAGSGIVNNNINNTGSFVVSASGSGAFSCGIVALGMNSGSVNNNTVNNTVSLVVNASGSNSIAYGILLGSGTSEDIDIFSATDIEHSILSGSGSVRNNTINNYGTITVSGSSATAILITGISSGNIINNYGTITSSGTAINIVNGSNNVINLRGYSVVNGLIAASGSNNVLNIAFSGLSKQAANALRAELTAEGALSGTATSGSFTVRGVTYTYDPLIVTLNTSSFSYEEQGKTPNQKAVGANLDSFTVNPTGNMLKLLNALDQSGNVANGLEQLSPQRYQVYGDIALSNANLLTQEVDQRLNNLRSGSEGIDASALGISYGSAQSKLGMGSNGLPAVAAFKDGKTTIEQAVEAKRWGAFLSGNVVFANVDGRGELQDSNFTNSGLIGGVDAKLTDALTAGVLLGYNHSDIDLDSQNSNANVDAYSAGLYGGYHEGNFYGNGLAVFTRNNYESDRSIDFPGYSQRANGRTSGSQYTVDLDGGYDQPLTKDLSVGPYAGLQYVHLGVNSFTESGAEAANLALNDQNLDSLRSRLGVRLELRKEVTPSWKVASEARLAWQHEFANNDRAIVAQFSGSGLSSFAVRTSDPERDAALIGLGLNATYRDSLTTFVDYDVQVGQSHYVEQVVKGGFKWNF